MSTNGASVFIAISPFIYTVSRGRYRCVAEPDQITHVLEDIEALSMGQNRSHEDAVVKFVVTARHLTVGTHRISDVRLNAGNWSVSDAKNNELGTVTLSGQNLSGLKDIFSKLPVRKGDSIRLSFEPDSRSITLTTA